MERKKLIRLAFIVIAGIVVLVTAEIVIRALNDVAVEKKKISELEDERKKYESTPKYEEEVFLEGVVADFMELLNSGDVDSLYEVLNEDYRDYKFNNNKEEFSSHINKYLKDNAELTLQTYENVNGKYLCRILSYENELYSSFQVLITQNEQDGAYDIIFDDITSIKKMSNKSQKKENIQYTVLYKVIAEGACSYTVEYKNIGNEDINYTYEDVTLSNSRGYSYSFDASSLALSLKPGETKREEYIFSGKGLNLYSNTTLGLTFKENGTNKLEFSIHLMEAGI